jgi:hypothetical protein
MSAVPFTFANQAGNIPLSELDTNFANVKAFANTAGTVTGNVQANITLLGTLSSLSVNGNIVGGNSITSAGNIVGGNNITSAGNIIAVGNLLVGKNAVITGNLEVDGNITYIASNTVTINDKFINVANNATLTFNNATTSWNTNIPLSVNGNITGANLNTTGTLSVTGTTTLTGVATAPTVSNATANTQVATTAFVRNIVPSGVITLWYGSLGSIPDGWFLCDGNNSTPDLRDRFVVGAGTTYSVDATGGSANAIVVSHSHTATSSVTDTGHSHVSDSNGAPNGGGGGAALTYGQGNHPGQPTLSAFTGISVATSVASAGASGTDANLPPYYALAYIMKA